MNTFEYIDYRLLIRDRQKQMPGGGRGLLTRLSEHLRIKTSLLSQIMGGARSLSEDQALETAEFLGLDQNEAHYFVLLVQQERASSQKLKKLLEKELLRLRQDALVLAKKFSNQETLSEADKLTFYSTWIYSAVHLFCSLKPDGVTSDEIMKRFKISRRRATEIINFLARTKFIEEKNQRYNMSVQTTFVPKGSPNLLRHHTHWRLKALQQVDQISDQEIMYTAQYTLSRTDFERVRLQIVELLKSVDELVLPSPAEEIAIFNLDWIWLG
jgi:uncharacterized protein (TIGR02147 family)